MGRGALGLFLGTTAMAAPPVQLNDPIEGQNLARELRTLAPAENAQLTGVLRISSRDAEPREVPLKSAVTAGITNWTTRYEARPTNAPSEQLTIRHAPDQSNEYEWQRGEQMVKFDGAHATNAFAGSDFALLDLGLEFFHWPTQLLAMREMRKGRGCDVLESRPAQTGLYSRVISWIDQESRKQGQPGLLMAEAYDPQGKILKEFEIIGFKKVDGQYQVSEMEIRSRQTKTRTRLQFNFDKQ